MKLEVRFHGVTVGAVYGRNRLDAMDQARKYFPDATSVDKYSGMDDLVWINDRFALRNCQ